MDAYGLLPRHAAAPTNQNNRTQTQEKRALDGDERLAPSAPTSVTERGFPAAVFFQHRAQMLNLTAQWQVNTK
jgi:hypothetical protein